MNKFIFKVLVALCLVICYGCSGKLDIALPSPSNIESEIKAHSPFIGIKDFEGTPYWTIKYGENGQENFILDSAGNKIPAIGRQGNNGNNGNTPTMCVKTDNDIMYWAYQYGDGESTYVLDNQGNKIPVYKDGQVGIVKSITPVQGDTTNLEFTLNDGTKYLIRRTTDIDFKIDHDKMLAEYGNASFPLMPSVKLYSDGLLNFWSTSMRVEVPIIISDNIVKITASPITGWHFIVDLQNKVIHIVSPSYEDIERSAFRGVVNFTAFDQKGHSISQSLDLHIVPSTFMNFFYNELKSVPIAPSNSVLNKLNFSNDEPIGLSMYCFNLGKPITNDNFINIELRTENGNLDRRMFRGYPDALLQLTKPLDFIGDPSQWLTAVYNSNEVQVFHFNPTTDPNNYVLGQFNALTTYYNPQQNGYGFAFTTPVPDNTFYSSNIYTLNNGIEYLNNRLNKVAREASIYIGRFKERMGIQDMSSFDVNKLKLIIPSNTNVFIDPTLNGRDITSLIVDSKYFSYDADHDVLKVDFSCFGIPNSKYSMLFFYDYDKTAIFNNEPFMVFNVNNDIATLDQSNRLIFASLVDQQYFGWSNQDNRQVRSVVYNISASSYPLTASVGSISSGLSISVSSPGEVTRPAIFIAPLNQQSNGVFRNNLVLKSKGVSILPNSDLDETNGLTFPWGSHAN